MLLEIKSFDQKIWQLLNWNMRENQAYFINIHVSLLAGHLHHTLDASSSCRKTY